ncbi:hypothetical protein J6590_063796 [Homalodisca vitripennis]|nr:hypothetical protein J6590_063796 [Homalodisca vitripennis]
MRFGLLTPTKQRFRNSFPEQPQQNGNAQHPDSTMGTNPEGDNISKQSEWTRAGVVSESCVCVPEMRFGCPAFV